VTIHVGDGGILYTWLCPRQVDVECARDLGQSSGRHSPIHQTIAGGAYADEGARGGRTRHEVRHPARRLLRLAALQAEHLPCPARLAQGVAPLRKKLRKIGAQHQDRTLVVDDRQPSFDPMADGIPMDFQGAATSSIV
jgi:hypothetical protein